MTIKLSFRKLADGTCNVFADIFSCCLKTDVQLTAERVKFVQVKPFVQDKDINTLFNIPYKNLKEFAKEILKKDN